MQSRDSGQSRISDIVVIGAWCGLAAGLIEAVVFTIVRLVPGLITWRARQANVSFDFLWIAPLINAAVFTAAAVALTFLAIVARRFVPQLTSATVFVMASLGLYAALRVPDRLTRASAAVLALGLATQLSRSYLRDPAGRSRFFRRTLLPLAAVVLVLGLTVRTAGYASEVIAVRRLSVAAPDTPNVLLIMLDTVRADHLTPYGYSRNTTPTLARLAAEGVLFERAMTTSSWTLPAHASIFTGRFLHEHGADTEHPELSGRFPTLAAQLRGRGFDTTGISANTVWVTRNTGLTRGFIRFEDYFTNGGDTLLRSVLGREVIGRAMRRLGRPLSDRKPADVVVDRFLRWNATRDSSHPYFAFLNFYDAHAPYVAPAPHRTQFMTDEQRRVPERVIEGLMPSVEGDVNRAQQELMIAAYDGALAYVDGQLARLLEGLHRRGELDRTLVVVVGDHGEGLGEHGMYGHGNSVFLDQIHVPLIAWQPRQLPRGRRISAPVSVADVPATILELATRSGGLPGRSLSRFWHEGGSNAAAPARAVVSEVGLHEGTPIEWPVHHGWTASLMDGPWHFIRYQDGRRALYDSRADAAELRDVAGETDPLVLERLEKALADARSAR